VIDVGADTAHPHRPPALEGQRRALGDVDALSAGGSWSRRTVVGALAIFTATRLLLVGFVPPFLDPDSYKYLGGADARWQGAPVPPMLTDLPIMGGALHFVPGYSWFVAAVWALAGRITLGSVVAAQAAVTLLAFVLTAHLVASRLGAAAGAAVLVVLCSSPTIAWIGHLVMPDGLVTPLLLMSIWVAANAAPGMRRRSAWGAALAGALTSANLLLRASSQAFVAIPVLVAVHRRIRWRAVPLWLLVYGVVAVGALAPWLLHNHRLHGVWTISASQGRYLLLSALAMDTVDRETLCHALGIACRPRTSDVDFVDRAFQRSLAEGRGIAAADRDVRNRCLEVYRSTEPARVLAGRLSLLRALFSQNLRPNRSVYLLNIGGSDAVRAWAQGRFAHEFSTELVDATTRREASRPASMLLDRWIQLLALEGIPLLVLYLVGTAVLALRRRPEWLLLLALALPPATFLTTYALFGVPAYRFQAALHPFMLATAVAAGVMLWRSRPRRTGRSTFVTPEGVLRTSDAGDTCGIEATGGEPARGPREPRTDP
jgi:hypothetical protein